MNRTRINRSSIGSYWISIVTAGLGDTEKRSGFALFRERWYVSALSCFNVKLSKSATVYPVSDLRLASGCWGFGNHLRARDSVLLVDGLAAC